MSHHERETRLREWFVKGKSPIEKVIDGFDIGWGGTAHWVSELLSDVIKEDHSRILDVACGYGTFLAELGWKFPSSELFGLNLNFDPPHSIINDLLKQAAVTTELIVGDAIKVPISSKCFDATTCFLGLQDIHISRGESGVLQAIEEMLRVTKNNGHVILVDNYQYSQFNSWLDITSHPHTVELVDSFNVQCQWSQEVGELAVQLYAEGTLQQQLDQNNPPESLEGTLKEIKREMKEDLERQIAERGYYNPWGTMQLIILKSGEIHE